MMNFIKTIGAFSLTFIFSVALVGLPQSAQNDISQFLQQDISNGHERDFDVYSMADVDSADEILISPEYAETVSEYVNASSSMDSSSLPADFQAAWRSHMAAWHDFDDLLSKSKTHCKMRKLSSEDFADQLAHKNLKINLTWHKVLTVADRYGVSVSEEDQ